MNIKKKYININDQNSLIPTKIAKDNNLNKLNITKSKCTVCSSSTNQRTCKYCQQNHCLNCLKKMVRKK